MSQIRRHRWHAFSSTTAAGAESFEHALDATGFGGATESFDLITDFSVAEGDVISVLSLELDFTVDLPNRRTDDALGDGYIRVTDTANGALVKQSLPAGFSARGPNGIPIPVAVLDGVSAEDLTSASSCSEPRSGGARAGWVCHPPAHGAKGQVGLALGQP